MEDSEEPAATSVEHLFEECLRAPRAQRAHALEAACTAHPEHASALRGLYASLGAVGALDVLDRSVEAALVPPQQLGEYRLIRELGSGGMGTVFLAEQPSLARLVAVKIIRPDQVFFEELRERFQREARLVAALKHPGIVSIHGSGIQNGAPYLVMEWIEGVSLAKVLEALRSLSRKGLRGADVARAIWPEDPRAAEAALFAGPWEDVALRIAASIAEALSHAHERGIVHRDVKPSNVMLTPDNRVILLDFGLARSDSVDRITRSGSQPGSLPYMAPERLRGGEQPDDLRGDTYSLGVTLYELLCGELPFEGSDIESLRQSIASGSSVSLRQRVRGLRADTETVCQHAFARLPDERYQSAAAFLADVQNVLAGRPIFARPPGVVRTLRQWVRTHPLAALSAGFALVLAVALPAIWISVELRAAQEIRMQRDRALEQSARSERLLDMVADVLDEFVSKVTSDRLSEVPGLTEVVSEIFEEALPYYEALIQESDERVISKLRAARASYQLALVLDRLGRNAEAQERVNECARVLAEIPVVPQLEEPQRVLRLQTSHLEASLRLEAGDPEAALVLLEAAVVRDSTHHRIDGDSSRALGSLARLHRRIATALRVLGRFEAGLQALQRATAILEPLIASLPDDVEHRRALASCLDEMGFLYYERHDLGAAKRALIDADGHWDRVREMRGVDPSARKGCASHYGILASVLMELQENEEADRRFQSALRDYRALHRDFPDEPDHALQILRLQVNHARLLEQLRRVEESRRATEEVIAFGEACSASIQSQSRFSVFMFLAHLRLAVLEANRADRGRAGLIVGELLAADAYARRVGDEGAQLEPDFVPNFATCQQRLANAFEPLCLFAMSQHLRAAAQVAFARAFDRTPRVVSIDMLMKNARRMAEISALRGELELERFWLLQSARCADVQSLRFLRVSESHGAIAYSYGRVVDVLLEQGLAAEAIAEAERSVACRRFVLEAAPPDKKLVVLTEDPLRALARGIPARVSALDRRAAEPERIASLAHIHLDWIAERAELSEAQLESLRKPSRTLLAALLPLAAEPSTPLARTLEALRQRLGEPPALGR